jgi:molybdopterin converting factor subunit 1
MQVRIRLFAQLRERAGTAELELELPEGACVRDALAALDELADGLPLVAAVNREYAQPDARLAAGDELALIPPVSGGAPDPTLHSCVTEEPLSPSELTARVSDPRAGAIVVFEGVTREVASLEYEAYVEMASAQIAAIVSAAAARHRLCAAAAEHRIGTVALGEPSVVVAVSAPHREQAFAAAREIIDAIKAQAPIWKREVSATGESTWVEGSSPTP